MCLSEFVHEPQSQVGQCEEDERHGCHGDDILPEVPGAGVWDTLEIQVLVTSRAENTWT